MKRIQLHWAEISEAIVLEEGEFVARWEDCIACDGLGTYESKPGEVHDCMWCFQGTGRVAVPINTTPCKLCWGEGYRKDPFVGDGERCGKCNGTGVDPVC